MRKHILFAGLLLWLSGFAAATAAETPGLRQAVNRGTIGVISGGVNGTYVRVAADLAAVLDGDGLRVLPMLGKGSLQNIADLLYLKGVDVAIVQSDALEYLKQRQIYDNLPRRVHFVSKLYNEEFHLLVKDPALHKPADLAGRKVNVDVDGSGTSMTAEVVFGTLGVKIEPTHFDQATAIEKLKSGEIAALVYVAGKPATLFQKLTAADGLRLLPIEPSPALLATYLPSRFSRADYPNLLGEGEETATLAVGAVLAVYNWNPGTQRYAQLAQFITRFLDRFDAFRQPGRHPKWQEVSIAAQVPGWTRARAAQQWLDQRPKP